MLQIQDNYVKKENYVIREKKSIVLSTNSRESEESVLNGTTLKQAESAVHLGITRENESKFGTSTVLEATKILQNDITDISLKYKRLLKQIQHLPDKTADAAVYLMLGEPPIQAETHRRLFTIFGSITITFCNYESVENQLAWQQLSVETNSSQSWFIMVKSL